MRREDAALLAVLPNEASNEEVPREDVRPLLAHEIDATVGTRAMGDGAKRRGDAGDALIHHVVHGLLRRGRKGEPGRVEDLVELGDRSDAIRLRRGDDDDRDVDE